MSVLFFFFNDTATTEIYTLSLHDALPIFGLHQLEPEHHVRLDQREIDLGHALLEDLERRLRVAHDVPPAEVGRGDEIAQDLRALVERLLARDDRHRVGVEAGLVPRPAGDGP